MFAALRESADGGKSFPYTMQDRRKNLWATDVRARVEGVQAWDN
jgi:hypothetical protein